MVRVWLDSSALASAFAPASPIPMSVSALTQHAITITTTTATSVLGHAQDRSSVASVLLESRALTSACTPASPKWLPVVPFAQKSPRMCYYSTYNIIYSFKPPVKHVLQRFSVVREPLDSSSLAS
jgi:hypothetical protein